MFFVVQDREKDIVTMEDLSKICRLCLRSDYYMKNLFASVSSSQNSSQPDPITQKINRAFHLEVSLLYLI